MDNLETYSFEEAYDASLKYFDGDELAARVWVSKYAIKDSFGNIFEKSPEVLHLNCHPSSVITEKDRLKG